MKRLLVLVGVVLCIGSSYSRAESYTYRVTGTYYDSLTDQEKDDLVGTVVFDDYDSPGLPDWLARKDDYSEEWVGFWVNSYEIYYGDSSFIGNTGCMYMFTRREWQTNKVYGYADGINVGLLYFSCTNKFFGEKPYLQDTFSVHESVYERQNPPITHMSFSRIPTTLGRKGIGKNSAPIPGDLTVTRLANNGVLIGYSIPHQFRSALIEVFSPNGRMVQRALIPRSADGQVRIANVPKTRLYMRLRVDGTVGPMRTLFQ